MNLNLILSFTVQSLAILTFLGFLLLVYVPKLKQGSSFKQLFGSSRKTTDMTLVFSFFYLILFYHVFWAWKNPTPAWFFYVGFVLACSGLVIAFMGRIQLRTVWSPVTHAVPSSSIIQTGVFRMFRHPIYLGRILFFAGGMLMYSLPGLILVPIYWWILRKKAIKEEELLQRSLSEYGRYCQRVKRWF